MEERYYITDLDTGEKIEVTKEQQAEYFEALEKAYSDFENGYKIPDCVLGAMNNSYEGNLSSIFDNSSSE